MNDCTKNILVILVAVLAGLAVIAHLPARLPEVHVERGIDWQSEPERTRFEVQDKAGQVFTLERVYLDKNLFVVWLNSGETNGLHSSTWRQTIWQWESD